MGWFWWFMLAADLAIPLCMIVIGFRWWRSRVPPYGGPSGYRTRRGLQSPAAWAFAHGFFGRLWAILGAVLLLLSIGAMLRCRGGDTGTVGWRGGAVCLVQCLVMLLPIPFTEIALRRMGG